MISSSPSSSLSNYSLRVYHSQGYATSSHWSVWESELTFSESALGSVQTDLGRINLYRFTKDSLSTQILTLLRTTEKPLLSNSNSRFSRVILKEARLDLLDICHDLKLLELPRVSTIKAICKGGHRLICTSRLHQIEICFHSFASWAFVEPIALHLIYSIVLSCGTCCYGLLFLFSFLHSLRGKF